MKVLFLTNIPSPYRVAFFEELGKSIDLTVLYELHDARNRDKGFSVESASKHYSAVFLKPMITRTESAFCPSVKKYLKDKSYDYIVVGGYATPTGMYAISYMKHHKIPFWLNCDGGFVPEIESVRKRKLKTYFISSASYYLSPGAFADEYLLHYGAKEDIIYRYPFTSLFDSDIAKYVYSKEEKAQMKADLGISQEAPMILAVGRFLDWKHYDILLRACGKVKSSFTLVIVGGNPSQEYLSLANGIEKNNTNFHVLFQIFMDKENLKKYYRAADVFAHPAVGEIWGLVVNEAMAQGLPVIATQKCGAALEMLEDSDRVIPSNEDELSNRIIRLLEDATLRQQSSERNLEIIRKYTIEAMAKRHLELWEKN